MKHPGNQAGAPKASLCKQQAKIGNVVIRCVWSFEGGRLADLSLANRESGQIVSIGTGCCPKSCSAMGVSLT